MLFLYKTIFSKIVLYVGILRSDLSISFRSYKTLLKEKNKESTWKSSSLLFRNRLYTTLSLHNTPTVRKISRKWPYLFKRHNTRHSDGISSKLRKQLCALFGVSCYLSTCFVMRSLCIQRVRAQWARALFRACVVSRPVR